MDGLQYGYYASKTYVAKSIGSQICLTCIGVCLFISIVLMVIGISGVNIASIVIGAIYFHDCELQPILPIFLIVNGCIFIGSNCCCSRNSDSQGDVDIFNYIVKTITGSIFKIAWMVWLVLGTIWVINVRDVIYAPDHCRNMTTNTTTNTANAASNCVTCNEVLTVFTFVIVIVHWIFSAIWIPCFIASICCYLYTYQNK